MKINDQHASDATVYTNSHFPEQQQFENVASYDQRKEDFSKEWNSIDDELFRIRNLPDDWDGEGSVAPHPSLVDYAVQVAQDLRFQGEFPPNRVHTSVNATIYFEWYNDFEYREMEVIAPKQIEVRTVKKQ